MENPDLPVNISTTFTRVKTNQNADFCYPFHTSHLQVIYPTWDLVKAVLNIVLAVSTTFLNILVFTAVRRNNSLRPPSKLLILSLICTDLGTGALTQPLFAAFLIAKTTNSLNTSCFLLSTSSLAMSFFCNASLSMMTAVSLDRFAAFFFHLKYREIVIMKRVRILLAILWLYSAVFASSIHWSITLYRYATICGLTISISTITAAYTKLYRGLRHHHGHQVQDQVQAQAAATALDVTKYRRTASSMMWIYGLFIFCYLPYFCLLLLHIYLPNNSLLSVLYELSLTLALLNSSLNPLVYCFRLPEIRAEVIQTVRKILCKNS